MYFASRVQAGRMLAAQLKDKYRYENCVVLTINDGGVMVGAQIANALHCALTQLLSSEIGRLRAPDATAAEAASNRAYNQSDSQGEIDEMVGEYRGLMEQEKLGQMHDMNRLLGSGGNVPKELLKGHNVIVVSDGMKTGFPIDLAHEFLKPIAIERLIVAVPLTSVSAVDRMHVLADELYCLSVVGEYDDTNHYYNNYDVPDHDSVIKIMEQIVLGWQ